MFTLVILALVATFNTGIAKPPSKIMNGRGVPITEAPFAVMLHDSSNLDSYTGLVCGGSIIGPKHILTAAHCLGRSISDTEDEYDYNWLRVVAGETSYECGVRTYEILVAYAHPDFVEMVDDVEEHADIAVLKLKERIIFGPKQRRIRMANQAPVTGSAGIVYGWGNTNPNEEEESLSHMLQHSIQTVHDYETCKQMAPEYEFRKDELCVKGYPGTMVCDGDSGSPIVVNGKVVGVVANALPCGSPEPAAITNVAYHTTWIYDAISGTAPSKVFPYRTETHYVSLSDLSDDSDDSDDSEGSHVSSGNEGNGNSNI